MPRPPSPVCRGKRVWSPRRRGRRSDVRRTDHGFSLLETVIATGLPMTVVAGAFAMLHPAQGAFATELESGDMQQRLRVGVDTLTRDLATAGAGAYAGGHTGPLLHSFASVQ